MIAPQEDNVTAPKMTSENIWNALFEEPGFRTVVPIEVQAVWRDLCAAVIPVLHPLADQPLSAESFLAAQIAVIRLMHEGKWEQKLIAAYPDACFPFGVRMEMVFADSPGSRLPELEALRGKVLATLAARGVTEEEFLAHPKVGRLSPASIARWRAGDFTIGDLMITHPSALLRND